MAGKKIQSEPLDQSQFYLLLESLLLREKRAFLLFLKGFYPEKKEEYKLLNYCIKNGNRKKPSQWEKGWIWENILGNEQEFNRNKFNKLTSTLTTRLGEYLLLVEHQKESITSKLELIKIYKKRGLSELFFKEIAKTRREIEAKPKSFENYFQLLRLAHLEFFHSFTSKSHPEPTLLLTAIRHLSLYYSGTMLQYAAELKNRAFITEDPDYNFPSEQVLQGDYSGYPLHQMYQQYYFFRKEDSKEGFQQFYTYLQQNYQQLSKLEQLIFLTYLINYQSVFVRKGELKAVNRIFGLYQWGLEKGILFDGKTMTYTRFFNILECACNAGERDWAGQFIEKHQSYLPPKHKTSTVELAQGILAFKNGQFTKAARHLRFINEMPEEHKIRYRILQISIDYELQEYEQVSTGCVNFDQFLNRNNALPNNQVQAAKNYIRIVRQLTSQKTAKELIIDELIACAAIYSKNWLQEKINSYQPIF